MKELIGSPGTASGLVLRIGQCMFAAASIGVMVSAIGFSNYTAFCYLIASMGLQVLWSFGLACLDVYALKIKRDLQNPVLVSLFVVGGLGDSHLIACSCMLICWVMVLYARDLDFCRAEMHIPCSRFQISIALAFITWFFIAISSHVMFWILASV
ncbi:CASP-like protein 5B2 [Vitis vinifera]|uniref:CASP-like protein n=1 Tax=Vitis vinifera TaxID=29760 RepID=A0A438HSJ9_VITVI|nr:CASP-like protein 5B2 [Vitis vinifera]